MENARPDYENIRDNLWNRADDSRCVKGNIICLLVLFMMFLVVLGVWALGWFDY